MTIQLTAMNNIDMEEIISPNVIHPYVLPERVAA
jgi:hypothetical protein